MNAPTRLTNAELADWSRQIDAAEAESFRVVPFSPWQGNPGQRRGYVRPCPQLHRIMANEQPRIAEDGPFPIGAVLAYVALCLLFAAALFGLWAMQNDPQIAVRVLAWLS